MDEVNAALQRIYSALNSSEKAVTSMEDWQIIFEYCTGKDYI